MNKTQAGKKILLIEDDQEVIRSVSAIAEKDLVLSLEAVSDGSQGLARALDGEFSLVIADINLPGLSGFEICRALRAQKPGQAILFLTGRHEEVDKVLGLELGGDDYITKPFSPRELAARVKALIRRVDRTQELVEVNPVIEFGNLRIDAMSRRVWLHGAPVALTYIEFELLSLLASNPGRTFERSELLEMVLGYTSGMHDDSLTVHFSKLRSKIEKDPKTPDYLVTVRGVGYRFVAPDEYRNRA